MMATTEAWESARLIPVSGIRGAEEQERRAASALLATIGAVQEFGREMLRPFGAPAGQISPYVEVQFDLDGTKYRVDGVLRVTRGRQTWQLLVEFKTGSSQLKREQVEAYLEISRREGLDGLLTVSNDLVAVPGHHPLAVDQRRFRGVPLHHMSWYRILSLARRVKDHQGVADPDQAWMLGELIRYLEHPNSGALAFEDMGAGWVAVRNSVADGTIRGSDPSAHDLAARWEQLLQFIALDLGTQLGENVQPVLRRAERADPARWIQALTRGIEERGVLAGTLRIPHAVSDLMIEADLRVMSGSVAVTLDAPDLKTPRARVNWLLRQLRDAPKDLRIDCQFVATSRTTSELLGAVDDQWKVLVDPVGRLPRAFTLTMSGPLGGNRKRGRNAFIDSVLDLVQNAYGRVVQDLRAWTPPAPQLRERPADEPSEQVLAPAPPQPHLETGPGLVRPPAGPTTPSLRSVET